MSQVYRVKSLLLYLDDIKLLIDDCYPLPPRNVFDMFIRDYREDYYSWIYTDNGVKGFCFLVPKGFGGRLEYVTVCPHYWGKGIGSRLVSTVINEIKGRILLETRIFGFYEKFGFMEVRQKSDGKRIMVCESNHD